MCSVETDPEAFIPKAGETNQIGTKGKKERDGAVSQISGLTKRKVCTGRYVSLRSKVVFLFPVMYDLSRRSDGIDGIWYLFESPLKKMK